MRIKFTFQQFDFDDLYGHLEIGDGVVSGGATRLARFSKTDIPSNVSSVSNAGWITVASSCYDREFSLRMTVMTENKSGMHTLLYNNVL